MPKEPLIEELFKNKAKKTYPTVVVSGSGDAWFLNPETRSMERIFRGSVVRRISSDADDRGRHQYLHRGIVERIDKQLKQ